MNSFNSSNIVELSIGSFQKWQVRKREKRDRWGRRRSLTARMAGPLPVLHLTAELSISVFRSVITELVRTPRNFLSLSLFLSSKIHARLRFRSRHEQRLLSSNNSYHAVLHFEKRKRKRKREEGENGRKQNCRVVIIILFPQNRRFGGRPESFWNFKLSHLLQLQEINRRMNFLLQLYVLIDKSNEWRNFLQCVRFSSKAKLSRMTTLLVFHRHKSKWDILRVQPCHLFV